MSSASLALPGQPLAQSSTNAPGSGTHIYNSIIHSSILGSTSTLGPKSKSKSSKTSAQKPALSVCRPTSAANPLLLPIPRPILPTLGSTVLGTITRLTLQRANISILAVDDTTTSYPIPGIIRREDIRATEKDRVKMSESFRVGDVVRGEVVSLGDMGGYYVSTGRNELGVVMAKTEGGEQMVPISWREMEGPGGVREARKVAKPF